MHCFMPERDPAPLLVDFEDHHFDLIAELHDLGRVDVLVGPVHFRHVHEAFDALLDFDERAVVGEVGDFAEQPRTRRVAARQADPRILAELLHAQRHAVLFLVELEDLGSHLVADGQHLGRVLDATPREVGDVQQAVDAAQVDERAVIGDVLDDTLDDRAFLQRFEQFLALRAEACLEHGAPRNHDVVALAIELDDLEFERLAFERCRVLDRPDVDQRAGQERTDAVDHHGEAALDLAGDEPGHDGALLHRRFEVVPRLEALGLVARQAGLAVAIFETFDGDGNEVASLDFNVALIVLEFFDRDETFRLQSGVDDDDVVIDASHFGGDQLALAHLLPRERFLEQGGKIFGLLSGIGGCGGCHMHLFPIGSSVAWGVGTGLFIESANRTALLTSFRRLALCRYSPAACSLPLLAGGLLLPPVFWRLSAADFSAAYFCHGASCRAGRCLGHSLNHCAATA